MNLFRLFKFSFFFIISLIANAEVKVETSSGIVEGYKKDRVIYWDDIPYAKPPIGQLRWKAPRAIDNSKNIILPKENNYCVQRPSSLGGPGGEGLYVGTEDCLYLDISAPVRKKSELSSGNVLDSWWWKYIWIKRPL